MRARCIRRASLTRFAGALLVTPAIVAAQSANTNGVTPSSATVEQVPAPAPAESHDYTGLEIAAGAVVAGGVALMAVRRRRVVDAVPRDTGPRPPTAPRSGTERDTMR